MNTACSGDIAKDGASANEPVELFVELSRDGTGPAVVTARYQEPKNTAPASELPTPAEVLSLALSIPNPDVSDTAFRAEQKRLGAKLYNALFLGNTLDVLNEAWSHVTDAGFAIRILASPAFQYLPFEAMYAKPIPRAPGRLAGFVADFGSITRVGPDGHLRQPLNREIRLLLVGAEPSDTGPLELEDEIDGLKTLFGAIKGVELVEPVICHGSTVRELLDRKYDEVGIHIVHLVVHGSVAELHADAGLGFAGSDGQTLQAYADHLHSIFVDWHGVRLVVFNSCWTGQTHSISFSSIVHQTAQAGVPAVVGMQFPISNQAALKFCQVFYRDLINRRKRIERRLRTRASNSAISRWTPMAALVLGASARELLEAAPKLAFVFLCLKIERDATVSQLRQIAEPLIANGVAGVVVAAWPDHVDVLTRFGKIVLRGWVSNDSDVERFAEIERDKHVAGRGSGPIVFTGSSGYNSFGSLRPGSADAPSDSGTTGA